MFFILGISPKTKAVGERTPIQVHECGKFGGYQLYEQSTTLTLFFIPIFSWNKKYLAESTCCHQWYEVEENEAKAVIKGERTQLDESCLKPLFHESGQKRCPYCHHLVKEEDYYCSHCGKPLEKIF